MCSLFCPALHCTALHCTALHCTALHCTTLKFTTLHCTVLHCLEWVETREVGVSDDCGPALTTGGEWNLRKGERAGIQSVMDQLQTKLLVLQNDHYISNRKFCCFSFIIAMVHQNSPTIEFWQEKIEGNLRRANTEPYFTRALPLENPSEQPCQPFPILPSSFN